MIDLINSIARVGCNIESAIVRPHPNGNGYEMISGHRRKKHLK